MREKLLQHSLSPLLLWTAVVLLALSITILFSNPLYAAPEAFTVTNTNDSGEGSLRQAIEDANSNNNPDDMDVIEFNIPGDGVHTIRPETQLTSIHEKVTINGYSQPGAAVNTAAAPQPLNNAIKIELDFGNINSGEGLIIFADGTVITGLSIYSASAINQLISFDANDGRFVGNYGGLKADGMTRVDVEDSIIQQGDGGAAILFFKEDKTGCRLGGSLPEERNVIATISGTTGQGTITINQSDCEIKGNYIGIAKDGVTDAGGEEVSPVAGSSVLHGLSGGLNINGGNVVVGGTESGDRNVLSGSGIYQLVLVGAGAAVQGNYIGTDYTGKVRSAISNGVGVATGPESLIGGTNTSQANIIAGVTGAGITVQRTKISAYSVDIATSKAAFMGNSIHSVGVFNYPGFGASNQGIDFLTMVDDKEQPTFEFEISDQGPNPNDPDDADDGPNGFINYPVLKTAQQIGNQLTITYDLDAADSPSNTYRVEFFANNERSIFGYGPGETFLGAATSVQPGMNKTATITVNGDFTGKALSATTTAIDNTTASGFGSTSEFAQNISIGSAEDFDADGVPDAIEDAAPNNGDGNNDGIPDKNQPTVSSYVTATVNSASVYATLITDGCSENGTVSSLNANSLQATDNGYEYPYGLTDFTLYCSRGDTVVVTMYVHAQTDPLRYIPRKFNAHTNTFSDIPGSTLTSEVLGASTALKLTYSLKDGGDLDDDGEENGIIVDPVGLASERSGVLAATGVITVAAMIVGILMVVGAIYTFVDYRRHRRPLEESDRFLASEYTYWHHLKVVTIPLAKYRLTFKLEKSKSTPKAKTA